MAAKARVCVLGAGVVGMSTAVSLAQSLPGAEVTVVAERFSPHTTSDGAAGLWEPYLLGDTPLHLQRKWGQDTFQHLMDLSLTSDGAKAGVFTVSGYTLHHNKVEDPSWSNVVFGFRHMTARELDQFPRYRQGTGWFYTSVIAECRFYIPWLTKRFKSLGGVIKQKKLSSIEEVGHSFDVIVNCTGLGSRELIGDQSLNPIRGQILKMHSPWVRHFVLADDDDVYVIPCSEYTVLGGTHDVGSWETTSVAKDRDFIFNGCCKLLPGLKHGRKVGDWTGLRPGRPSIRLESQIMHADKQPLKVVHNYGHGGAGVTLHWGCALQATELVKELLNESATAAKL